MGATSLVPGNLAGLFEPLAAMNIGSTNINLVAIFFTILLALAITRNMKHVAILQLPLAASLRAAAGIPYGEPMWIIYSILFLMNAFDIHSLGTQIMASANQAFDTSIETSGILNRFAERGNLRRQQKMLKATRRGRAGVAQQELRDQLYIGNKTRKHQILGAMQAADLELEQTRATTGLTIDRAQYEAGLQNEIALATWKQRKQGTLRAANEEDRIDAATQKYQRQRAIRAAESGDYVDRNTQQYQRNKAIRGAARADYVDRKTQRLQRKKAERTADRDLALATYNVSSGNAKKKIRVGQVLTRQSQAIRDQFESADILREYMPQLRSSEAARRKKIGQQKYQEAINTEIRAATAIQQDNEAEQIGYHRLLGSLGLKGGVVQTRNEPSRNMWQKPYIDFLNRDKNYPRYTSILERPRGIFNKKAVYGVGHARDYVPGGEGWEQENFKQAQYNKKPWYKLWN